MSHQEDPKSFSFPALRVRQPIGEFFVGAIDSRRLCEITDFDVRHLLQDRPIDTYIGIQRKVKPDRIREIEQYVTTIDACFPTAVILSVPGECAAYDDQTRLLTLSNYQDQVNPDRNVLYRQIAKVIDGEHRIEGLKK